MSAVAVKDDASAKGAAGIDCSVIIPAFNAARFLEAAVSDALAQTSIRVEVLVIDDCSTDETPALMARLADPRLVYHRQGQNAGPARARNTGLSLARGAWIALLDADDRMGPGRLASLVDTAVREDLDLVADNLWVESGSIRTLHIAEALDGRLSEIGLADLFDQSRMGQKRAEYGYLKPVFRRSFLEAHALRYDETLKIGEDLMFVAEILAHGGRYGRVASSDYVYVRHEGSISHRLKPGQVEAMQAADRAFLARRHAELSPRERSAVKAHSRNLEEAGAYIRMLDALKGRRIQRFLGEVAAHPTAVRHFGEPLGNRLARLFPARSPRGGPKGPAAARPT